MKKYTVFVPRGKVISRKPPYGVKNWVLPKS